MCPSQHALAAPVSHAHGHAVLCCGHDHTCLCKSTILLARPRLLARGMLTGLPGSSSAGSTHQQAGRPRPNCKFYNPSTILLLPWHGTTCSSSSMLP